MTNYPLKIDFLRLSDTAHKPVKAHKGDAGYDLCSTECIILKPFQRKLIPTGLCIELPDGYAGFVLPRSGLAIRSGFSLVNTPGLIDSNFRGEIKVIAINLDPRKDIEIKAGDRIAQLVIMKVSDIAFKESCELSDSERGSGGFGSSGLDSLDA